MDYDDFSQRFLAALYLETEKTGQQYHNAGDLISKYAFEIRSTWIDRIADEWEGSYFRDVSKVLGGYNAWSFRISASGSREVESEFRDLAEIEEALSVGVASPSQSADVIDSSAWTGLPSSFSLNENRKAELSALLAQAEGHLDNFGLANSEKAMARAYIIAAKVLADAPDPPADLIWEIIGRANSISGVASLLVSIIALFQTAIN